MCVDRECGKSCLNHTSRGTGISLLLSHLLSKDWPIGLPSNIKYSIKAVLTNVGLQNIKKQILDDTGVIAVVVSFFHFFDVLWLLEKERDAKTCQ